MEKIYIVKGKFRCIFIFYRWLHRLMLKFRHKSHNFHIRYFLNYTFEIEIFIAQNDFFNNLFKKSV